LDENDSRGNSLRVEKQDMEGISKQFTLKH